MFSFRVKLKRGVILYTVLFVALILGLLTVWFFKSSQNARATAFRFEQSEVVRRLARGAADEAFMVAFKQTADPKSDVGKWLITQADKWFDNTGSFKSIPIPVSLSQAQANEIVKQRWTYLTPEITASAAVFDARRFERGKPSGRELYPGEAIGTLQFTVKAALKKNGKDAASCTLVRHHDFRITSMVSKKGLGRSRYAPNFLLDYLLFVRHGLREFKESAGQSLNNNAGIVFKQDSSNPDNNNVWGKIFFGETEDPSGSNFVFLNLTEKFKELVPQFTPNPKVLKELGYDGVTKLIPRIEDKVSAGEKEIMEKVKDPNDPKAGEKAAKKLRDAFIKGTHGTFEVELKTLFSDQTQGLIEMIRDAENDPWRKNISPGIELISPELAKDPKISCSILEGTICKRFLYNVKFKVDLTKVRDILKTENREAAEEIDEKDLKSEFHCKHPDKSNPDTEKFNKALVQNRILWERDLPLLSQFVDFLPMEKDDKQIPPPLPKELTRDNFPAARLAIFSRGGDGRYPIKASDQGFYPYGYVTTRSRVFESIEQLEEFGIIEYPKPNMPGTRGKLNLRGNIAVIPTEEQLVELGKDGPLEINGQGVLMSYWGFNIKDELVKSGNGKNNLCVLRSINGPININTDKKIEAALIAINTTREGTPLLRISVSKSLNLKGALAADYLGAQYWPKSSHVIEYDSAFQSPEDLFQIYISRFVTFLRITETAS